MKDKLEQIFDKHHEGCEVYNKDEIIKELLVLFAFKGCSPEIIEQEYFKMQQRWSQKISASDFNFGWSCCKNWYKNNL